MKQCNSVPWISIVVGILAIVSPWVHGAISVAAAASMTAAGFVIALTGIVELSLHGGCEPACKRWPLVHVVAGLWLIGTMGLVAGNSHEMWNSFVLGVIAAVTGLVSFSHEVAAADDGTESPPLPAWRR